MKFRSITYMVTLLFAIILFSISCKKSDKESPGNPVITDTGIFKINTITRTDVNEFTVSYLATPPTGETYSNLKFIWSTSADFQTPRDSVSITETSTQPGNLSLEGLPQATSFFGRIGITLKGRRFYSQPVSFSTDTFKIVGPGYFDPPRGFTKGDTSIAYTNRQQVLGQPGSNTKIYFGSYECPLVSDQGFTIEFKVPLTIPSGKYKMKIISRGMEATWPDSIEVLRGLWKRVTPPDIPVNPNATTAGLVFFGTCYSPQKGYIVGGIYLNGPPISYPNSQWPEYILEFTPQQESWLKRTIADPLYFEDPQCYYYNNAIYVVAGHHWTTDPFGNQHGMSLKKIKRLDLTSLVWSDVSDVPYPTIFNLCSFELNGEFYVGMGADSANRTLCCGTPLPSKKFWKYSPASNQWAPLADFPGGHQNFPTSFTIGSKAYVFYGAIPFGDPVSLDNYKQELWEYDPASNVWTQIQLPAFGGPGPGEKYQITSYNGKAYFISAQYRMLFASGFGYLGTAPCLEWNPVSNTFKPVAYPLDQNILRTVFRQGNTFYYKTDAFGYFTSTPNKAFSFTIE